MLKIVLFSSIICVFVVVYIAVGVLRCFCRGGFVLLLEFVVLLGRVVVEVALLRGCFIAGCFAVGVVVGGGRKHLIANTNLY